MVRIGSRKKPFRMLPLFLRGRGSSHLWKRDVVLFLRKSLERAASSKGILEESGSPGGKSSERAAPRGGFLRPFRTENRAGDPANYRAPASRARRPKRQTSVGAPIFFGAPTGIRTQDLLLRRQLLYPTELLAQINVERAMGVEPTYPAWKAGILADVLCPRNSIAYYSKRTPICQRNRPSASKKVHRFREARACNARRFGI